MSRRAASVAIAAVAIWAAAPAQAQSADQVIADLDRFRSALGTHYSANVVVDDGTPETLRIAARPDAVELVDLDGNRADVAPDDSSQPALMRLMAAVFATGTSSDALLGLGAPLGAQALSFEVFESTHGPVLARRVGTAASSVLVEHGTSRPLSWRVTIEGAVWQADCVGFGTVAAGWLPDELVLRRDGRIVATVRVVDAAPDAASLTPLRTDAQGERLPPLRFPRLPL